MTEGKSSIFVVLGLLGLLLFSARGCDQPEPPGPGQTERLSNLAILVVEDSTQRTPEQAALLTDPAWRAWATARAARLRITDCNAVRADGQPSTLLGPYVAWRSSAANQSVMLPVCLLVRSDGSVYRGGRLLDSADAVKQWVASQTVP